MIWYKIYRDAFPAVANTAHHISSNLVEPPCKENLQRVCGGFLAAVERYKEIVPKHFLDTTLPEIEKSCLNTII